MQENARKVQQQQNAFVDVAAVAVVANVVDDDDVAADGLRDNVSTADDVVVATTASYFNAITYGSLYGH